MPISIRDLLDRSRKELLDLTNHNRLLSIPTSRMARLVQVNDEQSEQVFERLVKEKKAFSFLPCQNERSPAKEDQNLNVEESDDETLPQPDEPKEEGEIAKRHRDLRLQTDLTSEQLQRRLLDLYRDAQTTIEEQGINILYLVLGQLKWFELDEPMTARYAPILLIPVRLERKTASERFRLVWTEEDIEENLSLRAKLEMDFKIPLPEFPDEENFQLKDYFEKITHSIVNVKGWEVLHNKITLGFFSFAKFLMYHDLAPDAWPEPAKLLEHPLIKGLLQDGFSDNASLMLDTDDLDALIPVSRLDHVVDADSSQTAAIEMVRQGRNLVIQGPPGTGKSQSITNIIATAVLDGKRVLFVAEKLAALEVVKRRLEREGLGPLCLELHSHKTNKGSTIDEIGRTWKLGRPKSTIPGSFIQKLEKKRAVLNNHAKMLGRKLDPSGLSPFEVMEQLIVLGAKGQDHITFQFENAENWKPDERAECRRAVENLAARIENMGVPMQHPWRGVCVEAILHMDLPPIINNVRSLKSRLVQLQETTSDLAAALCLPEPENFLAIKRLQLIADRVVNAPPMDRESIRNNIWSRMDDLEALLSEGQKFLSASKQAGNTVLEGVWETDLTSERIHIANHGKSLFRILNKNYRQSINQVRSYFGLEFPRTFEQRIVLLDALISGQQSFRKIRAADDLGKSAFGSLWNREKTDWMAVGNVLDWVKSLKQLGLDQDFLVFYSEIPDIRPISSLWETLKTRLMVAENDTLKLSEQLKLDWKTAFGVNAQQEANITALQERCELCAQNPEELTQWNMYFVNAQQARQEKLGALVDLMEKGQVLPSEAVRCFDHIYFTQLMRAFVAIIPELARFDGIAHNKDVSGFQKVDQERLALARFATLAVHHERMPANAGAGTTGLLKSEIERKRGRRSIRRLLKDTGSVIQAIKPVFMMSPLSVAQFLEPGAVEFDLLVIDEASQVQPVDALGAIARCKQMVVVGDSKQLPPTRFFMRLTSDFSQEEEEEYGVAAQAKDIESILGLCCARCIPQTMLRWHYRSRHHSLIAVSNREFYEDRLCIVPSPLDVTAGLGLSFHYVAEGVFDSGRSGTNRVEAKEVCKRIVEHVRTAPHLSLGVATFSIRQRQAILDELELLRLEKPELESFFSNHVTEPFFVKNLENVQGDERDVIFISVGYGKDAQGFLAMRFGPLSQDGGERRLNVLISRAKKRCEVFSSIKATEIDLNRVKGRGVAALKTFLSFAEDGQTVTPTMSGKEETLDFMGIVQKSLASQGFTAHPRVGIAGFYIDLAVMHPDQNGSYLLGIECDGMQYQAYHCARDRDRLRQSVLEDHGWAIHRIWVKDWLQRPKDELRKVFDAVEKARKRSIIEQPKPEPDATEEPIIERESTAPVAQEISSLAVPYKEAVVEVPLDRDPHQLPAPKLGEIIMKVIKQEGPIHEDEMAIRIRNFWGLTRAGARIQDAVTKSIKYLMVYRFCQREDGFLFLSDAPIPIRNRESASSANLKKPEMLPPMEIREAILNVIKAHHGIATVDLPITIARLFGFKMTSPGLRKLVDAQMNRLLKAGAIQEIEGTLKMS